MSNYEGTDLSRRYSTSVQNAPDTTGVFIGTVTRVVSTSEVYVRIPRLTGVFENLVRLGVEGVSVGDQVYVSLVEGRRDEFVILGKQAQIAALYPTNEPTGFTRQSDSTFSFDATTKTFTIQPVSSSFEVWCKGISYTKTAPESVTISDSSEVHYVIYSDGNLLTKTTPFDLENEAPVAYIYWNYVDQVAYFIADERHGIVMDWQTHEYLHRTRGAALASGLSLTDFTITGTGGANADATVGLTNGTFFDEDIQIDITHAASPQPYTWQQRIQTNAYLPVFYKSGSAGLWKRDAATAYPVKYGTRAQYNLNTAGTWSTVDATSNKFVIYWVVATNNVNEATAISGPVLSIMGQGEYDNIGQAEAVAWSDMNMTGLPIFEFRILYKLIFQTNSGYTNAVKSKLVSTTDLRVSVTMASGVPAVLVTDHGYLTGLTDDDHTQYSLVSGTRPFTGSVTVGSTSSTANQSLTVLSSDGFQSEVNAYGANQGTGVVYVGQSASFGGGISYNGDGTPAFATGEIADGVTFFRRDAGVNTAVFRYMYNSSTVVFSGQVQSTVASGTAPLVVASGTLVSNLNANYVEGQNLAALDTRYINTSGDTMTGTLVSTSHTGVLAGAPADGAVFDFQVNTNAIGAQPFTRQWADVARFKVPTLTETSTDGTTFTTTTSDTWTHRPFIGDVSGFNGQTGIDGTTLKSVRWTYAGNLQFSAFRWAALAFRYNAVAPQATLVWETSPDGVTWTTRATATIGASANRWVFVRLNEGTYSLSQNRFTLTQTAGIIYLTSFQLLSDRPGDQGSGENKELPFASIGNGRSVVMQPTLANYPALQVRGANSQTAALQQWSDPAGTTIYLQVLSDGRLQSTLATGTAPLVVASTTAVTNLNADLLDGQHGTYYNAAANLTGTSLPATIVSSSLTSVGTLGSLVVTGTVSGSQYTSTVATGTAPLVVSSTTEVANLRSATATALATSRTFSLTGNVTATGVSFNGSGDVALSTTIASGSVTNAMLSSASGEPNATWTSFTPVIYVGGTASTLGTGGQATGAYMKIGKLIYAIADIRFSTTAGAALGGTGNITVTVPTQPDLFSGSFLLLGTLRVTGLGIGAAFVSDQPIGSTSSTQITWRYPDGYPLGSDVVWTNTAPAAPILNAANAMRVTYTVLYLSST